MAALSVLAAVLVISAASTVADGSSDREELSEQDAMLSQVHDQKYATHAGAQAIERPPGG